MEDLDTLVLRTAQGWQAAGLPVVLVTVARTWGSSPRPPGSLMAINGRGETVGSVSGGCIEDDLIHRIREGGVQAACATDAPTVLRYGISADLLYAVARVESNLNPQAVNRSHLQRTGSYDIGLMQINSGHLSALSRHGIREIDLFEPCTNIQVGAWLLTRMMAGDPDAQQIDIEAEALRSHAFDILLFR